MWTLSSSSGMGLSSLTMLEVEIDGGEVGELPYRSLHGVAGCSAPLASLTVGFQA